MDNDGTAALWAQATAIQNVKALIPVTLDLKASKFFQVAQHGLYRRHHARPG
jgi:hypothetical protein